MGGWVQAARLQHLFRAPWAGRLYAVPAAAYRSIDSQTPRILYCVVVDDTAQARLETPQVQHQALQWKGGTSKGCAASTTACKWQGPGNHTRGWHPPLRRTAGLPELLGRQCLSARAGAPGVLPAAAAASEGHPVALHGPP